jgi:hypothetical protein
MTGKSRYVILERQWHAGRWVNATTVITDRLTQTPDMEGVLAAYEVQGAGRSADVVATVLLYEASGRPRSMSVRRLWGPEQEAT